MAGDKLIPSGAITLEFAMNGNLAYRVKDKAFLGTYRLGMDDRVIFQFDEKLAGRTTHVQQVKIIGDRLTLIDTDGQQLIFSKD